MNLLISLLLAVAVGDKRYDPEVYVQVSPYTKNRAVCYAYTGFWVVDEVGVDRKTHKTYAAASRHTEDFVAAIFSTFDFNFDAYYDGESEPLPQAMRECQEYDNDLSWLNICADFRQRPDLLPNMCYDNPSK